MQVSSNLNNGGVPASEPGLSLKQAIKDYRDEQLTGLTDEEKKKLEQLKKEYLESNKVQTKGERDAFEAYVKSLLKDFGFKGDIDQKAAGLAGSDDKFENANKPPVQADVMEHYQRAAAGMAAVKNQFFS